MKITDWDAIAERFSEVDDPEERSVLTFIRDKLRTFQPQRLLDYGGGDGKFSILCAESLSLQEIVTYDPAPRMTSLAQSLCADFKQVHVAQSTTEIVPGTFDVVTFNGVWMCLTSQKACLNTLVEIARLLRPNGRLVASVTHPCFRTCKFSNYSTDFDDRDYFNDGTLFKVTIHDQNGELRLIDTHWSLSAMSAQLNESGFAIESLDELPRTANGASEPNASLWLVIVARKL